jgi:hypothetical protein
MWRAISYVDGFKIKIQNHAAEQLIIQHTQIGNMQLNCENSVKNTLKISTSDLIFAGQGLMLTMQVKPQD